MAPPSKRSVKDSDESNSSKRQKKSIELSDNSEFYDKVVVPDGDYDTYFKKTLPPKPIDEELYKLVLLQMEYFKLFDCKDCRKRNFFLAQNDPKFKPNKIDDKWYRRLRDCCENCTRYNISIYNILNEWKNKTNDSDEPGFIPLPLPIPSDNQIWKMHYSIVTAGTIFTLMCNECKEYNKNALKKCPPRYLSDGYSRMSIYNCMGCFAAQAAVVDRIRDGFPTLLKQEIMNRSGV